MVDWDLCMQLYAKVLGQDFQFSVPTSSTQWVLNRNEYFRLIFEVRYSTNDVCALSPVMAIAVPCPSPILKTLAPGFCLNTMH